MKSKFWTVYLVFLLAILAGLIALHFYVKGIMVDYESQNPDLYVNELLGKVSEKDGQIGQFLEEHEGPFLWCPGVSEERRRGADRLRGRSRARRQHGPGRERYS